MLPGAEPVMFGGLNETIKERRKTTRLSILANAVVSLRDLDRVHLSLYNLQKEHDASRSSLRSP